MSRLRYSRFRLAEEDKGNLMMACVNKMGVSKSPQDRGGRDVAQGPFRALCPYKTHQEAV